MIEIKTFTVNMIEENCYVVSDPTGEAVIIDCGALTPEEQDEICSYIRTKSLTPKHLICTHAHFDHIFGVDFIHRTYGLRPEMHAADMPLYAQAAQQTRAILGQESSWSLPPVGTKLAGGDTVTFGTHRLAVIETPGHTPGGVCFHCAEEGVLFSGDSLFQCSIGRTDLPGGDGKALVDSLRSRILTLPEETTVWPGHGPATHIGYERKYNPYLRAKA